jgi:hypothetical protein
MSANATVALTGRMENVFVQTFLAILSSTVLMSLFQLVRTYMVIVSVYQITIGIIRPACLWYQNLAPPFNHPNHVLKYTSGI